MTKIGTDDRKMDVKRRIALNTLNKKLLSSNRIEDCIKATEDERISEKTHEEFGIK